MRVRFIRSWQHYRVGQEFANFHDGAASELIRRGVVVRVEIEEDPPAKKKGRREYMVPPEGRHA